MLPSDWPMKRTEELHLLLVSPAVFEDDQE